MSVSDKPSTLRAQMKHHEPIVCYPINTMVATRGGRDDMRTTFGIGEDGDPQFTISAAHCHAVCYAPKCANCSEYAETVTAATLLTGYHYGGGVETRP